MGNTHRPFKRDRGANRDDFRRKAKITHFLVGELDYKINPFFNGLIKGQGETAKSLLGERGISSFESDSNIRPR